MLASWGYARSPVNGHSVPRLFQDVLSWQGDVLNQRNGGTTVSDVCCKLSRGKALAGTMGFVSEFIATNQKF